MRNMILPYLLLWLLAGCGLIDRVAIENQRRTAINMLIHAEATKSLSWSACLEAYASPRLARQEKQVALPCGPPPPTVVTFSWRAGDVPTVSLIPPLNPFVLFGGVLGGAQ